MLVPTGPRPLLRRILSSIVIVMDILGVGVVMRITNSQFIPLSSPAKRLNCLKNFVHMSRNSDLPPNMSNFSVGVDKEG